MVFLDNIIMQLNKNFAKGIVICALLRIMMIRAGFRKTIGAPTQQAVLLL